LLDAPDALRVWCVPDRVVRTSSSSEGIDAAYELVTSMTAQHNQTLPISEWIEHWEHIKKSIDDTLDT
jgi:hypothetical protein